MNETRPPCHTWVISATERKREKKLFQCKKNKNKFAYCNIKKMSNFISKPFLFHWKIYRQISFGTAWELKPCLVVASSLCYLRNTNMHMSIFLKNIFQWTFPALMMRIPWFRPGSVDPWRVKNTHKLFVVW